jgi:3-hydroxyacyl-[acyl-carrier-protein] dehydratase
MPGVLIVEALAQAGAILMRHGHEGEPQLPFLAGIDGARFRRQVVPGDELLLDLAVKRQRPGSCKLQGVARVGDEVAAEAEIFAVLRAAAGH